MTPQLAFCLNGKWSIPIFIVTLISFVAESQLTQYVQTNLQYRQPYFLFYLVHSSFLVVYPCHILYLTLSTSKSSLELWESVKRATAKRLSQRSDRFPVGKVFYLVLALTTGVTVPALLWFAAISIASVTDVTAIWNTNAFFAYIFSVKVFGLKWEARRLAAVVIATLGTVAVVYGGTQSTNSEASASAAATTVQNVLPTSSSHLAGDLLTVIASVGYGGYQVFYKKYAALLSDPDPEGLEHDDYQSVPAADDDGDVEAGDSSQIDDNPPPFGLYPNFLTSSIGVCTLLLLWIPIPFLHWFGAEPFRLPSNWRTIGAIAGIALSGSFFNAGFMILLGLWGPIITSVGGLLTIVLVFISDLLLGATETFNVWTVTGSATIVVAFGVLAYDMLGR